MFSIVKQSNNLKITIHVKWENKAEGGRQKAEGGRWKVEGGRRKAEGGRWKVEGRRWKVEGRRQKAEGRRWKVLLDSVRDKDFHLPPSTFNLKIQP